MPKLNRKLTEKEILNAKPKDKPYRLYDSEGLTILVRPHGAKVWQYRYRLHGKENIYSIGEVGKISSGEAREERLRMSKLVEKGISPNQQKKDALQASRWDADHSFRNVAEGWYSKQTWAPKHAKNINAAWKRTFTPSLAVNPLKMCRSGMSSKCLSGLKPEGLWMWPNALTNTAWGGV